MASEVDLTTCATDAGVLLGYSSTYDDLVGDPWYDIDTEHTAMRRAATRDLATAAKGVAGGVRATVSLSLHWILRHG